MNKKVIAIVVLLILVLGAWLSYQHFKTNTTRQTVLSVLPEDAVYILKTDELTDTWKEVSKVNIWQHLIRTKGFEYLQSVDTLLNETLLQSKTSKYIFDNRPTAMAAYVTTPTDYDFIYTVDLKNTTYIKKILDKLLALGKRYKVIKLTYNQIKLYKLIDKKDAGNTIFITALDNVLAASFSFKLIKKLLDEKNQKHWIKQPAFKKIDETLGSGLVQFYFNYKQLPAFAKIYMKDAGATTDIAKQLVLSGFDINHDDERILMDGYTLTDSIPSYINALLDVKPGKMSAYQIISKQTAMFTSIGFKNFDLFYQSMLNQYTENEHSKTTYRENIKKLEKFLKIDLQEDLFDWIGQEICLVKMRSDQPQQPADVLMLIHSKDMDNTRKGLNHLSEQIRKRSPFKFKTNVYKNFKIYYLHQKGFFKTILGDLFKNIDKPYYTYIEDFVVFSNSERVLKHFIDDYITGNTLSHDSDFMDFKDDFQNKSNMFVYIQMPKLYDMLQKSLNIKSRQNLKEKQNLILSFSRIGLQLTAKDDMFKTILNIDHDQEALKKEQAERITKQIDKSVHHTFFEDLQFKIAFPDSLQIADGVYKQYFEGTKIIKTEGHVKDNLPIGIWRTYYPSGHLKSVVHYDNGDVDGDMFYYFDKAGQKIMVETHYDDDLLDGDYLEYWDNGALKAKLHYKDGRLHGDAEYYYTTGQIKIRGKYRKGYKKGKWLFYDQKGNVTHKKRYSGFLF